MENSKVKAANQEIQKSSKKGTLAIVCALDVDAYNVLSGEDAANRMASLQERIQQVLNQYEPAGRNEIKVERLELSYLSMTHVWRNA